MSNQTVNCGSRAFAAAAMMFALLACGCSQPGDSAKPAAVAPTAAVLPSGLIMSTAGEGAREVIDVNKNAKDGDEVTLHGRVGGTESPFAADVATIALTDSSLKFCSEAGHMKNCPTPWDMCCDDPNEVAAKSVTVRVLGADGRPVKGTVNGAGGMKPMSELVVSGIVRRPADGKTVFVDATKIFVKG